MSRLCRWLPPLLLAACPMAFTPVFSSDGNPYRDLLLDWDKKIRPTKVLTREEVLRDLHSLNRIFSEGYSGYETLEKEGLDWHSLFQDIRQEAEGKERWRQKEFADLLKRGLAAVPDLHLGLVYRDEWVPVRRPETVSFTGLVVRKEGEKTWRVLRAPSAHADAVDGEFLGIDGTMDSQCLFKTLPGKRGSQDYLVGKWSSSSDPAPARIRVRSVGGSILEWEQPLYPSKQRLRNLSSRPFRLTYTPFPRIELRTFSSLADSDLARFLDSATRTRSHDIVVVDLRGNRGGSDRFAVQWLTSFFGKESRGWEVMELISPVTLQGDVLLHRWLEKRTGPRSGKGPIERRLAYAEEQLEIAEKENVQKHWERFVPEPPPSPTEAELFQGRLLILVDSNTGSSAESFVMRARQFPQTIVLGENTRGMMRFGEVKLYPLPCSRIWIQAGSKKFSDPTGTFVEGRGLLPDFWIQEPDSISGIVDRVVRAGLVEGSSDSM